ncbi:MAG: hypothetical protein NT069_03710 [Planctomycetota bacterium]|nr:hypothetical protein [Planctomycetota bacterium]
MAHDWTWLIGRASGAVFLSGLCVLLAARWRSPASPRWHRLAWSLVLLQGLILFPVSLNIACPAGWMPRRDPGGAHHSIPSSTGSRQMANHAVDQPTIAARNFRDDSGADGPVTPPQANVAGERPPAFSEPVESAIHDDLPAELKAIDDPARPIARTHFADARTAATGSSGAQATIQGQGHPSAEILRELKFID